MAETQAETGEELPDCGPRGWQFALWALGVCMDLVEKHPEMVGEFKATPANDRIRELKEKADSFDALWNVCVELGMKVHPAGYDEDGEYMPEPYAYQFGFIRGLAEQNATLQAENERLKDQVERFEKREARIAAIARDHLISNSIPGGGVCNRTPIVPTTPEGGQP